MASLWAAGAIESFAAAAAALYCAWPQLSADQRRQGLQAAMEGAASRVHKPGWPLCCRTLGGAQLRCDKSNRTDGAFLRVYERRRRTVA
jgi:hypothetical protein